MGGQGVRNSGGLGTTLHLSTFQPSENSAFQRLGARGAGVIAPRVTGGPLVTSTPVRGAREGEVRESRVGRRGQGGRRLDLLGEQAGENKGQKVKGK